MPAPTESFLEAVLVSLQEYLDRRSQEVEIQWRVLTETPEILWSGSEYGRISCVPSIIFDRTGASRELLNISLTLILVENTAAISQELGIVDDIWLYNWQQWLIQELVKLNDQGITDEDGSTKIEYGDRIYRNFFKGISFVTPPEVRRRQQQDGRELATVTFRGSWEFVRLDLLEN